jgi:hypothetical protein
MTLSSVNMWYFVDPYQGNSDMTRMTLSSLNMWYFVDPYQGNSDILI